MIKLGDLIYKFILQENRKQAKELVIQGKLSPSDFETIVKIDPSTTKKYTGWMAKQWINKDINGIKSIDDLRNVIEKYDVFTKSGKTSVSDIYQFKTFKDLESEIDKINKSGPESKSELRDDYEIVRDDDKLLIAVPHSHEASRYLGLSKFAYRDCEGGGKDSAWCTTYKAPDHWNDHYFSKGNTLYYIKVKSPELIQLVKNTFNNAAMMVVALVVDKNGKLIDGYNADDTQLSSTEISKFRKITGI